MFDDELVEHPGASSSADRAAVGLGPGASEEELRAAQAMSNPALLALLGLLAGAAAGAVRAALNKPNRDGNLPIHRALEGMAPGTELVRDMLDAGGEAMLAVPGDFKWLPLHVAAVNSLNPAVVALLLARGPAGAAQAEDEAGDTPLWLAEKFNKGRENWEEIKAPLRAAVQ
jgi:hypothetical protein